MNRILVTFIISALTIVNLYAQSGKEEHNHSNAHTATDSIKKIIPTAWTVTSPLGLRQVAVVDTILYNYFQKSIPSEVTPAYAATGNLGTEGQTMLFFEREKMSNFFFEDALRAWIPSEKTHKFYNTAQPMTLLSYNFGGDKETSQDRLKGEFSGNVNAKTQFGAYIDYIFSKGSYNYQACKDLTWGLSGSHIGDRWEMQAFYYHYNFLNKENGGITDDRYITDPAEIQGGSTKVDSKTIPTNLSAAHSKIVGLNFYMNNKYNFGYYNENIVEDSVVSRKYVPVSSIIWTINFKEAKHIFLNSQPTQAAKFWDNTYLYDKGTNDRSNYWLLKNTVGLSLLEGFNKYAKAGLAAFVTHEFRRYNQTIDSIGNLTVTPDGLTPYPIAKIAPRGDENLLWVGGQLTKQQGSLLKYNATAQFGLLGASIGDVMVDGEISANFKLFGDTVSIIGYGSFSNEEAPYLTKHYVSNHFIWNNDFGKVRRLKFGGKLNIPHTNTFINVGAENLQNYVYFNEKCMPVQHSGNVQVFSASLDQKLKLGILHWDNKITYQTASNESVIPMPNLSVYSNLYLLFKIAKVLDVQFGVDCDYYTKYKGLGYQPATMTFYNQNDIEVGNYPFMNAYVNMKLDKARFYVLVSHVNQGLTGSNYFMMPHYPMNPRKFQFGVSVDFAN
ncbi:MAG: putative porin [Muribaculaceae bacterium]|nr:putative porin [Muribaculaceae bacterium]